MENAPGLSTPSSSTSMMEYRAAFDLLSLPLMMTRLSFQPDVNIGEGRYVCVLPGFGASDRSMYPLRFYLEKHGFKTFGWGLGTNRAGLDRDHDPEQVSWVEDVPDPYNGETGVPHLCDLMVERIREFHAEKDETVSLVGWSLGGTIAREVARDLPDIVDHVVTMGSPLIGGPKYTAAAPILASRGLDLDWIEREAERRNNIPLRCRATAIVSPTDGVVDRSASKIPDDESTEYHEVDVPHLGMGINEKTLALVLESLTQ